jgi:uncharacterized protein
MTAGAHIHHTIALRWFDALDGDALVWFCRVTQMSLLRLLTTETGMGSETLSQIEAWRAYDELLDDDRISFLGEPTNIERQFRLLSSRSHSAPKGWTDDYLAAFASSANLTLVSFDRGFRHKVKNLQLLSI